MLFKNNNTKVIKRLTQKTLRTNFTRNIFAVLAIVLTTFMITSVFSIGFSFAENYQTMMVRTQGTTASIALEKPTVQQVNELQKINDLTDVGISIHAGKISNSYLKDEDTNINLLYADKVMWTRQMTPAISDVVGKYPQKENELMISRWSLKNLGINKPKVGMTIHLPYVAEDKEKEMDFVLSGYYTDYSINPSSGTILVAKEFIMSHQLSIANNGSVMMTVASNKKPSIADTLEKEIRLNKGQKFSYSYDVTEDIGSTKMATLSVIFIIAMFIVLSGYLLIYNVLYIAVTKDIRFYGLLKTIGTSPRQVKKIVRGQALRLSLIGIPIGLLIGMLVSFVIVPMAMSTFGSSGAPVLMPKEVYFHPLIFAGAAIFSLITIMLSCWKPAKIAGEISPVEATRYTGIKRKRQKKFRKTVSGGKLHKMAFYNIFRDRKRAIIVFLSLFMGLLTFLSINTFLSSLKLENYLNAYVENDFSIEHLPPLDDHLSDSVIDDIKEMEGVESIRLKKATSVEVDMSQGFFLPIIQNAMSLWGEGTRDELKDYLENVKQNPGSYTTWLESIDTKQLKELNKEQNLSIDVEAFEQGDIALVDTSFIQEEYIDEVKKLNGQKFKIRNQKTGHERSYTFVGVNDHLSGGLPSPLGAPDIIVSHQEMNRINEHAFTHIVDIDVQKKNEPEIKQKLTQLISQEERSLVLEARSDTAEEFSSSQRVMNILGGGMSLILILIGILNFVNIMVTGVNVRQKELAVMESIGMTKKQIKKMLMLEGVWYAGITLCLVYSLGVAIIFGIAKLTQKIADYAQFSFPMVPLVSLTIVIFGICIVTPIIVFNSVGRASVTERLKINEN